MIPTSIRTLFKKFTTHSLAKNSIIVFAGTMLLNLSSYLYHAVVARFLSPEGYGELAALMALLYIINVPTEVLRTTLIKFFSTLKAQKKTEEVRYLFVWSTKTLIVFLTVGFITSLPMIPLLADFLHIEQYEHFMLLYLVFATMLLTTIGVSFFLGLQQFTRSVIYGNIAGVLRVLFGGVGALFGVTETLLAGVLSNIVGYVMYVVAILRSLPKKSIKMSIRKRHIATYSVPVFISTLGMMLLFTQDVIWVKHYFSSYEAGLYASLAILGKIIYFATLAIGMVVFPIVAERTELGHDHKKLVYVVLAAIGVMASGITMFYFLFPQFMITVLLGSSYIDAAGYVGFFGLFLSLFSLASILMQICLAAGFTRIWILTIFAAGVQALLLVRFHQELIHVIWANTGVSTVLFLSLLVYYHYAKRPS